MAIVIKCTCEHEFQDRTHGKGMRVYNVGAKESKCTVCSKKISNIIKGDK